MAHQVQTGDVFSLPLGVDVTHGERSLKVVSVRWPRVNLAANRTRTTLKLWLSNGRLCVVHQKREYLHFPQDHPNYISVLPEPEARPVEPTFDARDFYRTGESLRMTMGEFKESFTVLKVTKCFVTIRGRYSTFRCKVKYTPACGESRSPRLAISTPCGYLHFREVDL